MGEAVLGSAEKLASGNDPCGWSNDEGEEDTAHESEVSCAWPDLTTGTYSGKAEACRDSVPCRGRGRAIGLKTVLPFSTS